MDWNRLLCEVRTLRDRKHNNVTPLLSSFAAGNAEAHLENDNQEKLYMILPRAVGTLAEWMTSDEPPYLTNLQIRREYIYEIMFSLASGVAYIHREINHIVGFHHDLKPTNILNFPGEDRPVWKICDFGGSNLKDAVEETGTSHYIHTVLYTPEEFFVPDGSKHGRAYDVFSLGCIILELATLCRYGWSEIGLPEFEKRRFEHCKDHEVRKDHKIAYYRSPNVVKKWMTELGEKQDSKGFCELLNLIEQMLLVPRFQRIFAWEVEVDLVWIKNPEVGPDDALVLERLREVVQSPRKPSNAISSAHNPLMRAIRLGRSHEVQEILRNAQWSDISPGVTKELLHSQPRHVGRYYSTLVSPQGSSPLYGRQKEYNWLQRKFKDRNTLGLYGLGGIGYASYNTVTTLFRG